MATKSLVHLNNNVMCAIDCETTGKSPGYHEMIQLAIIPLDNWLEPRKDAPIFDIRIRPRYIERIDMDALEVSKQELQTVIDTGIDSEKAFELFEHWFEKLKLPFRKNIVPLGYAITTFDIPFIRDWMGGEAYNTYFHGFARDGLTIVNFLNDVSDLHAEQTPFNKYKLKDVARALGIEVLSSRTHDAIYDAYIAAEVYRKLLNHHLINPI